MGGSAQNTLLTLLSLSNEYDLTLITGPSDLPSSSSEGRCLDSMLHSLSERGVRIIEIPELKRSISPWNDFSALISLTLLLKRLRPSGVHTHTSKAGFIGRIASWLAGAPWVVHTPHGHVFWGHFGPRASWIFFQMERFACKITHHLIALTCGEADDYVRLGVMEARRISVIPSGVSLERFSRAGGRGREKRAELAIEPEAVVVGFVGWLWPVKGPVFLLRAMIAVMKADPRVHLVLVGKGDEEPFLRAMAEEASLLERIHFLGWRSDVHELFHCFDLLALPSLNEGMGRVLVEAMAAGLAVIGTNVGGIPDLIKDGENGLLVPPADVGALEKAILRLVDSSDERLAMGRKGRALCRGFSVEVMVEKIDEVYKRMQNDHSFPKRTIRI